MRSLSPICRSFSGGFLGKQADIASGALRSEEVRTLNNIVGDYYVPPAFMDAVSLHLVKNVLADEGKLNWKVSNVLREEPAWPQPEWSGGLRWQRQRCRGWISSGTSAAAAPSETGRVWRQRHRSGGCRSVRQLTD